MKALMAVATISIFAAIAFAQVNYRFNDSPHPEADVIIATYHLVDTGNELWLVGKLFNRGLKPAHNVRIMPNLYSKYGNLLPATPIELRPSDIPPKSFADFSDRVFMTGDDSVVARPSAEWSK